MCPLCLFDFKQAGYQVTGQILSDLQRKSFSGLAVTSYRQMSGRTAILVGTSRDSGHVLTLKRMILT